MQKYFEAPSVESQATGHLESPLVSMLTRLGFPPAQPTLVTLVHQDGREVPQDLMARYKKTLWPRWWAANDGLQPTSDGLQPNGLSKPRWFYLVLKQNVLRPVGVHSLCSIMTRVS